MKASANSSILSSATSCEDIEVTNVEKKSEDILIQIYFLLLWEYLLLLLESWYVINCGNHKII